MRAGQGEFDSSPNFYRDNGGHHGNGSMNGNGFSSLSEFPESDEVSFQEYISIILR